MCSCLCVFTYCPRYDHRFRQKRTRLKTLFKVRTFENAALPYQCGWRKRRGVFLIVAVWTIDKNALVWTGPESICTIHGQAIFFKSTAGLSPSN